MQPRRASEKKAAGLYAWTGPLREKRHRVLRLARASYRCAAIAAAATLYAALRLATGHMSALQLALTVVPALFATGLFLLGRHAAIEVRTIEEELHVLEANAVHALEERS